MEWTPDTMCNDMARALKWNQGPYRIHFIEPCERDAEGRTGRVVGTLIYLPPGETMETLEAAERKEVAR